jgi:carbonic anhydrase/acetyltransferase-like protein (isoleucine patch superfamily)
MMIDWQAKRPVVAEKAFIAPTAVLIGDVVIEAGASIWFGAVLRGDQGPIVVRSGANVQDNVVVHVDSIHPTVVGEDVTVGHGAVLEACTIERGAVVGMNAVVMNGALVGEEAMVAAGAVVPEGMQIPARHLVAGVPAVVKKQLSGRSLEWVRMAAPDYRKLSETYHHLTSDPARIAPWGDKQYS